MRRKLTPEECQIIRNIVEYNECSIYEQYSGRGMYGDTCFGIDVDRYSTGDVGTMMMCIAEDLSEADIDINAFEWKLRTDSLGLGTIYYFPCLQWNEECAEDKD
jgi:hypothetical protein